MEILYSKQAEKFLDKLTDKHVAILANAIHGLTFKPPKGDIRKLKGRKGEKRLRVGAIRVIYKEAEDMIYVSGIDFRGSIY